MSLECFSAKQALLQYLKELPPGRVAAQQDLSLLLSNVWPCLEGSSEEGTASYKLVGRVEDAEWVPPLLTFVLERHGATVLGSSRASLHRWQVDTEKWTATLTSSSGYRQLDPRSSPLNVAPIADELARAMLSNDEHKWLERKPDGTVKIRISAIVPETNKQTTTARRKRLRNALAERLLPNGLVEVRPHVWKWNS